MQFYDLHHCQYYQYICNVCGPIKEVWSPLISNFQWLGD
jgi:hypothetical protein